MIALLYNIRSLHNVGSILRTAEGAGIQKIYLIGITPSPVDRFGRYRSQIAKVALGAERTVPWESVRSASVLIKKLRAEGYKIIALEQSSKSTSLFSLKPNASHLKTVLMVGSEVGGIPPRILRMCDEIAEIPMRGAMVRHVRHPRRTGRGKESLNVAVAFGIAAYAFSGRARRKARQRRLLAAPDCLQ